MRPDSAEKVTTNMKSEERTTKASMADMLNECKTEYDIKI